MKDGLLYVLFVTCVLLWIAASEHHDPVDFANRNGYNFQLCSIVENVTFTDYFETNRSVAYENPLRGLVPRCGFATNFPHSLCYLEIEWYSVMTGASSFDWSSVTNVLASEASKGVSVVIRIVAESTNCTYAVPAHLSPVIYVTDSSDNSGGGITGCSGISPKYSDAPLNAAFLSTIASFGGQFNGDNRIAFVESGFVGFGGSWRVSTENGSLNLPSSGQRSAILNGWITAMPSAPIVTPFPIGSPASTDWGYSDELFGFATYTTPASGPPPSSFLSVIEAALGNDTYLSSARGGTVASSVQDGLWGGGVPCNDCESFGSCVDTSHASYLKVLTEALEAPWNCNPAQYSSSLLNHAMLGYEFSLTSFSVKFESCNTNGPYPMHAEVEMSNTGTAPFYQTIELLYRNEDDTSTLLDFGSIASMQPNGQIHKFFLDSSVPSMLDYHHGGLKLSTAGTAAKDVLFVNSGVSSSKTMTDVQFNFADLVTLPINSHITCSPSRHDWNFFTFTVPHSSDFYVRVAVINGIVELYILEDDFPTPTTAYKHAQGNINQDARLDVKNNHWEEWHASVYASTDAIYFVNVATLYNGPLCGNGVVETGEDCDPGIVDYNDCCSIDCKFEPSTYVCRPYSDVGMCDIDTYCTGNSEPCPPVEYRDDFSTCNDQDFCTLDTLCLSGKCLQGKVQSHAMCTCVLDEECIDYVHQCVNWTCNTNTSFCQYSNLTNGESCTDYDECTTHDRCSSTSACVGINSCSGDCSDHGRCCRSECICDEGWEGDDCSLSTGRIKWWGWALIGLGCLTGSCCCISVPTVLLIIAVFGVGVLLNILGCFGTISGAIVGKVARSRYVKKNAWKTGVRYDPRSELEAPQRKSGRFAPVGGSGGSRGRGGSEMSAPLVGGGESDPSSSEGKRFAGSFTPVVLPSSGTGGVSSAAATTTTTTTTTPPLEPTRRSTSANAVVDPALVQPMPLPPPLLDDAFASPPLPLLGNPDGDDYIDDDGAIYNVSAGAGAGASSNEIHRALWNFTGAVEGELSLTAGDEVKVVETADDGWWTGILVKTGEKGIFPASYCESS